MHSTRRIRVLGYWITGYALALGTCASSPAAQELPLVYRAPREKVDAAVEVLRARLGTSVGVRAAEDGLIRVELHEGADVEATRMLAETRGMLEFLLAATADDWDGADPREQQRVLVEWLALHADAPVHSWPVQPPEGIVWARNPRQEVPVEEQVMALVRSERPEWRFTQDDLAACSRSMDAFGYPAIGIELLESRGDAMGEFTAANLGRQIAVMFDGEVLVLTTFSEPLYADFQVPGYPVPLTEEGVDHIVTILRAGPLPAPLQFVEIRGLQ